MDFYLYTIGCKLNQCETQKLARWLEGRGLNISPQARDADVVILNTCAVTGESLRKSRKKMRKFLKEGKKVIVTGCAYEAFPEEFKESSGSIRMAWRDSFLLKLLPLSQRARIFIKIEDGCYRRCNYCLPSRIRKYYSIPHELIVSQIESAIEMGFHEVVLTGLNISLYRDGNVSLKGLLRKLERIFCNRDIMIRLSSVEPEFLDVEFFEIFSSPLFAKHLHIPFQSFSERVLKNMGRSTVDHRFIFNMIEKNFENMGIGVDIIAGYHGEGRDEFEETLKVIKDSPITYLHVFPFSSRKGTPDYNRDNGIPEEEKRERVRRLKEIDMEKRRKFRQKQENRVLRGVVVGEDKILTENYIHFPFEGEVPPGRLVEVKIRGGRAYIYEEHKISVNL